MIDSRPNFQIKSFIIFDPTLTDKENEEEQKILFCHPRTISNNEQTMTIGLCEAMSNFAREFTDSHCQYIHTMKTRIILHKLESDMSMILTVNIPTNAEHIPSKTATENHKKSDIDDYKDEEVQNSICESILSHCRQMFFLFMGPPSLIIKTSGIENLKEKLAKFFNRYISQGMLDNYQITDELTGIQYLVMDKEMSTKVEEFTHKFEQKFPFIFCSMFLFNNNLINSTVDKDDLGILYRYITTTLLARYNVNETIKSVFTSTNMGRFVLVTQESTVGFQGSSLPKIFFGTNEYLLDNINMVKECYVLVYKALQATIVLFIDQNTQINEAFKSAIDEYLGPKITVLAQQISKSNVKISNNVADSPFKYLYWNPETMSVKCTLFPTRQWKSDFAPLIPLETMGLMTDIKHELTRNRAVKEMAVKLHSDSWVTGVKDHERELLVAINKRNYSLVDVSKELKLICNRDFPDIFNLESE